MVSLVLRLVWLIWLGVRVLIRELVAWIGRLVGIVRLVGGGVLVESSRIGPLVSLEGGGGGLPVSNIG